MTQEEYPLLELAYEIKEHFPTKFISQEEELIRKIYSMRHSYARNQNGDPLR